MSLGIISTGPGVWYDHTRPLGSQYYGGPGVSATGEILDPSRTIFGQSATAVAQALNPPTSQYTEGQNGPVDPQLAAVIRSLAEYYGLAPVTILSVQKVPQGFFNPQTGLDYYISGLVVLRDGRTVQASIFFPSAINDPAQQLSRLAGIMLPPPQVYTPPAPSTPPPPPAQTTTVTTPPPEQPPPQPPPAPSSSQTAPQPPSTPAQEQTTSEQPTKDETVLEDILPATGGDFQRAAQQITALPAQVAEKTGLPEWAIWAGAAVVLYLLTRRDSK